jgi:peptidoglycan/xylan/chitin deacetylase (PgdA/CDA1 family)
MRLLVKQTLAIVLYYTGLLYLWESVKRWRKPAGGVTILAYHCFLDWRAPLRRYLQPGLCMVPAHFDHQLAFFKRRGRLMSLDDYVDRLESGEPFPKRTVIVTIDDGWRDNYDYAFPILKRHQAPATVFLTTDYIESDRQFWFLRIGRLLENSDLSPREVATRLAPVLGVGAGTVEKSVSDGCGRLDRDRLFDQLKKLDFDNQAAAVDSLEKLTEPDQADTPAGPRYTLTWDEVLEMSRGGVSFGSHGNSHQIMTLLTPDSAQTELESSRTRLAASIGLDIRHFAYPNGDLTLDLAELVKRAGYDSGLATGGGTGPNEGDLGRYTIRRIGMHDAVSLGVGGRFSKAMLALHLARFG